MHESVLKSKILRSLFLVSTVIILTCWSLHTEPTLLRLLLLMAMGCPIEGMEATPPEPPAIDTVMLMLLYTSCWPKVCPALWPDWLNRLNQENTQG